MEIPERWRELITLEENSRDYRDKDWVRFKVTHLDKDGTERTTEVTAPTKIHAASQVSMLGKVQSVTPQ